jgi:hypothetical protein
MSSASTCEGIAGERSLGEGTGEEIEGILEESGKRGDNGDYE